MQTGDAHFGAMHENMWPVLRPGAAGRFGPERTKSGSLFGCGIGRGFEEPHARRAAQEFLQLAECEAALNLRAISHRLVDIDV
ncbi:hypothetical protein AWB67_06622 [Caballeronia terrestris]|uniref:Uncharacterized protein n=1 Tax=Caballeronia terrestris TaxID=1226301 RepID=A0A158KSV7_9BURK|nr:hypothetical protein [Caballeronia terrestris]SAL84218.1 hypothetical protein AWB67_06622 [Caballeronia terrestris]